MSKLIRKLRIKWYRFIGKEWTEIIKKFNYE